MPLRPRIGGSFAPPLSDALLSVYKTRIEALIPSPIKDSCTTLLNCCEKWWDLPEPVNGKTTPHPVGVGTILHMDEDHKKALDQHIPWEHEIVAIGEVLEGISNETHRDLRNMAFHLLWHVRELNLDREPLTADKL